MSDLIPHAKEKACHLGEERRVADSSKLPKPPPNLIGFYSRWYWIQSTLWWWVDKSRSRNDKLGVRLTEFLWPFTVPRTAAASARIFLSTKSRTWKARTVPRSEGSSFTFIVCNSVTALMVLVPMSVWTNPSRVFWMILTHLAIFLIFCKIGSDGSWAHCLMHRLFEQPRLQQVRRHNHIWSPWSFGLWKTCCVHSLETFKHM